MSLICTYCHKTPFGELILGSFEERLCLCDWMYREHRTRIDTRIKRYLRTDFLFKKSNIVEQAIVQLNEYFELKRKTFELPLLTIGTDLQKSVWDTLLTIPYGVTRTYKELSVIMNNPKAIRAIASANGANALSIIIPCHRIVATGNKLGGYAGGLDAKSNLLNLEASAINQC